MVNMKTCCFIIPYFGKLPNYFQLFLNSCSTNKNYDWLILTDDNTSFIYPNNVKRVIMEFEEIVRLFSQKLDLPLTISKPYKLCDFKPAFGYIFSDYLNKYIFWGNCDIDIIMGDLDAYLTNDLINSYDKLFCLGHLILYRNTPVVNKAFMTDGHYINIFTHNECLGFDEMPKGNKIIKIDQLFEKNELKIYKESFAMDVLTSGSYFRRVLYDSKNDKFVYERIKKALYVWNNGKIVRYYINSQKELTSEEFLYVHLQKRKMKLSKKLDLNSMSFKIIPNAFMTLRNTPVTLHNFKRENKIQTGRKLLGFIVNIIGFFYALYMKVNPFTVEIVHYNKIWWRHWHTWMMFVPKCGLY